jgi:phosphatidate cytidylyltransferase
VSYWIGKYFASLASKLSDGTTKRGLECRIAKDVSPNKTWATGFAAAVFVSFLSLVFVPIMPHFQDGRLSFGYSLVIGFLIGVFGLFGDLVFSMVKRDLKSKDTGTILPSHGGIIDRVDSLVFTIPVTFHLIYWMYF